MSSGFTDGSAAPQQPEPFRRRRRPKPPPTAYSHPPGSTLELPPGHAAQVFPLPTSTGFVGEAFSMDSLEFMRWAALRYDSDRFILVVLLTLMGCQEPGGLIEATHGDVARHLEYSRSHISRAFHVLESDGALRRVRRGLYQLNPAASLRGGMRAPEKGKRGQQAGKAERVDQLDLLRHVLDDPDVPEVFRAMALPGARLEARTVADAEGRAQS